MIGAGANRIERCPRRLGNHERLFMVCAAFLLVGTFAYRQVASGLVRLRYPGEVNVIEGMRLAEMVHLRQGVPIYAPVAPERFDASIYGPLYYLLGARLISPHEPAYFPLRLLSALAVLGSATGCGLLAFWLSRSLIAAALAPMVFLSYGLVSRHLMSGRADSVALLLCFWGFLVAYRFKESRWLLLATPLMAAGFFYKPQYVAGPLAILLSLILEKRYRLAVEFAVLLSALGLGLLVVFQSVVFRGQAFTQHLVVYNALPFAWGWFRGGLVFVVAILLPPLWGAVYFLKHFSNQWITSYLGCALLLGFLTTAKEGSNATNYFFEAILVLSAVLPAFFARRTSAPSSAGSLLVLVAISVGLGQFSGLALPNGEDAVRDRAVQGYLRSHFMPGTEAWGFYVGDPLRAGLKVPISDVYQYAHLIRSGRFADRDLLTDIRQQRFGVIVMNYDLRIKEDHKTDYMTGPLRQSILDNYRLDASMELPRPQRIEDDDRFYAWVPR